MSAALLQARGLSRRFGGVLATDAVDLDLRGGEIHALIGPNGAGKSTLIGLLSGAIRADAGSIVLDGQEVSTRSVHQRVALGLARSFQVTRILGRFTVLENMLLAVQARSGSSLRFWRPVSADAALHAQARALLERVGLAARAGDVAGTLAHGEQRQLELALALGTGARLMLLDEPMAGLGAGESDGMVALIRALGAQVGLLLVEHDMDAVFALASRISVLVGGRIIATGSPDEIRASSLVRQAYLGEGA